MPVLRIAVLLASLLVAGGCAREDVDFTGRACPCGGGWQCVAGICVERALDSGPSGADAGPSPEDAGPPTRDGGSSGMDAGPQSSDAGLPPTDAGSPSSDAGPPSCDWRVPFAFVDVEVLPELNSAASEGNPAYSRDGLTLYFVSYRTGAGDVYEAHRADASWAARFEPPTLVGPDVISTADGDERFSVTPDGLTAFFGSNRAGGLGGTDIWTATRSTPSSDWENVQHVDNLSTAAEDYDGVLSPDGLAFVISPQGLGQDLVWSQRATLADSFPVPVPLLATPSNEFDASMTADQDVLLFAADRGSGRDLRYALRSGAGYGAEQLLPGDVNTVDTDEEPVVRPDGCEIIFTRNLATTGAELHRARYERLP